VTKALRVLGVALLVLWTLHTVVITGRILLDSHYTDLLRGDPQGAVRAPLGDLIQDATPGLVHSLPANGGMLVLVDSQEVGGFAYFWLTYWLYPRHVDVSGDLSAAATTTAAGIVYFQRSGSPDLTIPAGYQLQSDTVGSGGGHVLVFVRVGS
jgi:hypothetical protein